MGLSFLHKVTVTGICKVTKEPYSFDMSEKEYQAYLEWMLFGTKVIQKAIPTVSDENREFLMSQTSPKGWDLMFREIG